MFESTWFGEGKRLYFKQPFHELNSEYDKVVESGGRLLLGPHRKLKLRDVESGCNLFDMIASYLVRKHEGIQPSQVSNDIDDVALWSRLQLLCESDTQMAACANSVCISLRGSNVASLAQSRSQSIMLRFHRNGCY